MFDYRKIWEADDTQDWEIAKRLGIPPEAKNWQFIKRSLDWFPSDTEQRFLSQSKEFRDRWEKRHFSYDINRYGFRCDEFEDIIDNYAPEDIIVFLGCSFTFGIGVAAQYTFAYRTAKHLNKAYVNLGVAGSGLDTAFRVYSGWQPILKAGTTVVTTPPTSRMEGLRLNNYNLEESYKYPKFRYYHGNNIANDSEETQLRMLSLLDIRLDNIKREESLQAINSVATQTNSNLFVISPYSVPLIGDYERGRDKSHPGEEWHGAHSELIVSGINDKKWFKSTLIDENGTFSVESDFSIRNSIKNLEQAS